MIVTTSQRADRAVKQKAALLAERFHASYIERKKQPVTKLAAFYECPVLLVSKERLELHSGEGSPFFFHPGSAMFRVKRLLSGGEDELVKACGLAPGMSFLDCTMGPAADSITASAAVGESGWIQSLEANPYIAHIVQEGLKSWVDGPAELVEAMRSIQVEAADYYMYLKNVPDASFDVVYFDPMFEEAVESSGIAPLRPHAAYTDLTVEAVAEAKRIARRRVVLKDHFRSERFAKFGFRQQIRKTSKFHFGVIEKGDSGEQQ
ncbi:class I SAM-dependent methyltransferase [Domibacillus indicus]|uniref:class I SAM-dependent methyltransferase n=1 Tax=Domibacillus indicus TaxID=1437523 RepID=UPI000617D47E|nr:class I SAM-dependent methyltransferase [Domibacillus indicus]